MTDLVEFLHARLTDDERIARAAIADDGGQDGGFEDADWLTDTTRVRPRFGDAAAALIREFAVPARVLREVEAKRRIIDEHRPCTRQASWGEDETICGTCRYDEGLDTYQHPCPTLRLLALPYADHPDYREEWKPTTGPTCEHCGATIAIAGTKDGEGEAVCPSCQPDHPISVFLREQDGPSS